MVLKMKHITILSAKTAMIHKSKGDTESCRPKLARAQLIVYIPPSNILRTSFGLESTMEIIDQ